MVGILKDKSKSMGPRENQALSIRWSIGLENKGHYTTMDNYFTSIPLFEELLSKQICATRMYRIDCNRLPNSLENTH